MKTTVSIYEAKTHFSSLVASVAQSGGRIVISRHGKPVADLMAHRAPQTHALDLDPSLIGARFQGDPCAPLGAEDWPELLR